MKNTNINFDDIWIPYSIHTNKIDDGLDKIVKTILSLEKLEHLNATIKMIDNFEMYHKTKELTIRLKNMAYDKLNRADFLRFY